MDELRTHVDTGANGSVPEHTTDDMNREVELMFLRRCRWRGRSQNLVHKLVERQLLVHWPAKSYHLTRSM